MNINHTETVTLTQTINKHAKLFTKHKRQGLKMRKMWICVQNLPPRHERDR